jgi:uncharacterized membrane protein YgcG
MFAIVAVIVIGLIVALVAWQPWNQSGTTHNSTTIITQPNPANGNAGAGGSSAQGGSNSGGSSSGGFSSGGSSSGGSSSGGSSNGQ